MAPKEEKKAAKQPQAKAPVAVSADDAWDLFEKCDLRVGKIVECKVHPESDKLYIEKVDLGEESGPRTIGSGLQKFVTMEEMMDGRFVLVWANLKAKKLGGVPSHGMVLCASNEDHTICQIVRPPPGSKLGERVCIEGRAANQEKAAELNPKKKLDEKFSKFIMTDASCNAIYNDVKMTTSGGYLTVPSLAKCMIS